MAEIIGLEEKQEALLGLCEKLQDISIDLLESMKKFGNNDNVMAVLLLHKQLDLLGAVMILVIRKKSIVSNILVRTMLETMSQLYYSKLEPTYSEKWVHYQYIGNLRTIEKRKEIGISTSKHEEQKLVEDLKKHGYRYVTYGEKFENQHENFLRVERCLKDSRLPLSKWYLNYPYKPTSTIISIVEKDIEQTYDKEMKKGFRFLYQELSNKTHPSPNGMEDLYYIEDNCLKIKNDYLVSGVKSLVFAIELMARTVEIANSRFGGFHVDSLQIIANETDDIVSWFMNALLSENDSPE